MIVTIGKKKLIWINIIIWFAAVVFILFNNFAVRLYYQLKNGDIFQLDSVEYTISGSAFIIGSTNSGNIVLGYSQGNDMTSLYLKSGFDKEIDELEVLFSKDLTVIQNGDCKFLLNNTNPNLPYLSWMKNDVNIYFTMSDKPTFDLDFKAVCNIVSR